MTLRDEILRHLLASIELPPERWLDLTVDEIGAAWFREHGLSGDVSPVDRTYALVVADGNDAARARTHLDPEGSMLVFERGGGRDAAPAGLAERSRVRTRTGAWVLYKHPPTAAVVPSLSLLIVCQDQVAALAALLSQLALEPDEPAWEALIVDRGSLDGTLELIGRCSGDLRAWRAGRAATVEQAQAYGMRQARSQLVVLLTPEETPTTGFIGRLWAENQAIDAPAAP